jgi:hypothetical protein
MLGTTQAVELHQNVNCSKFLLAARHVEERLRYKISTKILDHFGLNNMQIVIIDSK